MDQIACRGSIHNNALFDRPVQNSQVLDIFPLVEDADLAKETGADGFERVKEVEEDVGVLVKGGGIDNEFVMAGHTCEEGVDARALGDVDEVDHVLDLWEELSP